MGFWIFSTRYAVSSVRSFVPYQLYKCNNLTGWVGGGVNVILPVRLQTLNRGSIAWLQSSASAPSCGTFSMMGSWVIQRGLMGAQMDTELYADCNSDEIFCEFQIIFLSSTSKLKTNNYPCLKAQFMLLHLPQRKRMGVNLDAGCLSFFPFFILKYFVIL